MEFESDEDAIDGLLLLSRSIPTVPSESPGHFHLGSLPAAVGPRKRAKAPLHREKQHKRRKDPGGRNVRSDRTSAEEACTRNEDCERLIRKKSKKQLSAQYALACEAKFMKAACDMLMNKKPYKQLAARRRLQGKLEIMLSDFLCLRSRMMSAGMADSPLFEQVESSAATIDQRLLIVP